MSSSSSKHFIRSNRQLIYGIFLIVIIPVLVVANSLFFIRQFNEIFSREQHRQAVLIGQVTEAFIAEELDSPQKLQALLENTLKGTEELTDLYISKPEGDDFIVWASVDQDRIGLIEDRTSAFFAIKNRRSVAQRVAAGDKQYWEVQYPILDEEEDVVALLTIELSTEAIDSEASNLIFRSFIILSAIITVIILLLASNNRLFQYAILYKRLQEIDKAKDDFISIASHELRTPITAMRNYFSMLLEGSYGKLSDEIKDSVTLMNKNTERLNDLVEDLLNVSRLQQGRISVEPKNIDMIPIINDAVTSLKATATEKKLELIFKKEKEQIIAYADPERIRQVIINIIGNALKYTEKGSVTVSLSEDVKNISIKVKDTGIGISAEAQQQLFEKFYRVVNKKTQNIIGTGLGLWLTREILELMGGKIYIDSIENVGTQVTVTVPVKKAGVEKEDSK